MCNKRLIGYNKSKKVFKSLDNSLFNLKLSYNEKFVCT
jgi:hypothetical protein